MILFQCAHDAYESLVELTCDHHEFLLPNWQFIRTFGKHSLVKPWMHNSWHKFLFLRELLHDLPDGEEVLYIDADSMILRWFLFIHALPVGYDFAAVRNIECQFNAGVMFWRNSKQVRAAMDRMWNERTGPEWDQTMLNRIVPTLKTVTLCPRWNLYKNAMGRSDERDDPFIKSWHTEGVEAAQRGMQTELHRAAGAA